MELLDPLLRIGEELIGTATTFAPRIVIALLMVVVGWIIGVVCGWIAKKACEWAEVDRRIKEAKLEKAVFGISVTNAARLLVKWYVFLIFVLEASKYIGFEHLALFLSSLLQWIPSAIVGAIILMIGNGLGDFANQKIRRMDIAFADFVGGLAYFFIMYFAIVIALPKFGVKPDILISAFNYFIMGIAAGIAIAIGLAFGLALKEPVAEFFKKPKGRKK